MDLYAFPPIAALLDGAHAVLMALAALLEPVIGIASAAAAVVLVTLLVRAALIPVGFSQAKAEQTRSRLAPKLAALQRQHKNNPERLQRETLQLYGDEGTTPFAGCLPRTTPNGITAVAIRSESALALSGSLKSTRHTRSAPKSDSSATACFSFPCVSK